MDNDQPKSNRSIELCQRKVTTGSFIAESKEIWGDQYDYSFVNYINGDYKVTVVCPYHGPFEVYAREHLDGKGCPKCRKGEEFVQKLRAKFGYKFLLDHYVYKDSTTPVELICPKHGPFRRLPHQILQSSCGCPECGIEHNNQAQIQRKEQKQKETQQIQEQTYRQISDYMSSVDNKNYFACADDIAQILQPLDDKTFSQLINILNSEKQHREAKALRSIPYQYRNDDYELPNSFVGVDFETLYAQRVSVCSVGMVKYIDGEIVDRYYTKIRPPFDYPTKCGCALTWIHGFTEESLKDERTFDEILPELEQFVGDLPLVAHNACVERCCFMEASAYYGLQPSIDCYEILDTLPVAKALEYKYEYRIEGSGTHSLDAVCRRFGVPVLSHHNALDDAEMCGNLMVLFYKIKNGLQDIVLNDDVRLQKVEERLKTRPEDRVQRSDLENVADNPFKNKNIVLTGFPCALSQKYAHILNEFGAIVRDGVTKKTQILITGNNAGPSKVQKCMELGAQIITEDEFLKMIDGI